MNRFIFPTLVMMFSFSLWGEIAGMGDHSSVQDDATTTRGTDVMGPETMGRPISPSSGPLRNRSNQAGGDISNSSQWSSDIDQTVPSSDPQIREPSGKEAQEEGPQKSRDVFKTGPYQEGDYQYLNRED